MDGSSSKEIREKEHNKIILVGFITCEAFNFKASSTNMFEGGCYVMTQGGHI